MSKTYKYQCFLTQPGHTVLRRVVFNDRYPEVEKHISPGYVVSHREEREATNPQEAFNQFMDSARVHVGVGVPHEILIIRNNIRLIKEVIS